MKAFVDTLDLSGRDDHLIDKVTAFVHRDEENALKENEE